MHKVFVYGTLKRGQRNHHLMQGAEEAVKFIGAARLAKPHPLILTKYGIPMLLAKEGAGKVVKNFYFFGWIEGKIFILIYTVDS